MKKHTRIAVAHYTQRLAQLNDTDSYREVKNYESKKTID